MRAGRTWPMVLAPGGAACGCRSKWLPLSLSRDAGLRVSRRVPKPPAPIAAVVVVGCGGMAAHLDRARPPRSMAAVGVAPPSRRIPPLRLLGHQRGVAHQRRAEGGREADWPQTQQRPCRWPRGQLSGERHAAGRRAHQAGAAISSACRCCRLRCRRCRLLRFPAPLRVVDHEQRTRRANHGRWPRVGRCSSGAVHGCVSRVQTERSGMGSGAIRSVGAWLRLREGEGGPQRQRLRRQSGCREGRDSCTRSQQRQHHDRHERQRSDEEDHGGVSGARAELRELRAG